MRCIEKTLYTNGRIVTMDAAGSVAEAVLVAGNVIEAVGPKDELAALARRFHALRGKRVALICKDRFLRALARDALRLAGHEVSSDAEITFSLTESQARVRSSVYFSLAC